VSFDIVRLNAGNAVDVQEEGAVVHEEGGEGGVEDMFSPDALNHKADSDMAVSMSEDGEDTAGM
jgi:hypothetical protein